MNTEQYNELQNINFDQIFFIRYYFPFACFAERKRKCKKKIEIPFSIYWKIEQVIGRSDCVVLLPAWLVVAVHTKRFSTEIMYGIETLCYSR